MVLSLVLGLAFALIAPLVSSKFTYVNELPGFALLFAISVPLYSIFCLEDAVLATVRRAVIIPFENASFGVLKIVLLFALAPFHIMPASMVILASWMLPLVFIIVPINLYLFKRGVPQAVRVLFLRIRPWPRIPGRGMTSPVTSSGCSAPFPSRWWRSLSWDRSVLPCSTYPSRSSPQLM